MPRTKKSDESFGQRLARLRKARGLTQRDLAPKLGISQRVLAYYEAQTDRPPSHLLGALSKILRCSTDELLGVERIHTEDAPVSPRFWRRLRRSEQLPPADRRAVLQFIDALIARRKQRQGKTD